MTDYESLKVPELKALLKERSLLQSGRKAELISRLQSADKAEAGAEEEEARPPGDAAPAEEQPRDDEQQPLQNGAVDGGGEKASEALHDAKVTQPESAPGDAAAVTGQCSPRKSDEQAVPDTEQEPAATANVEDKVTAEAPSVVEAPVAESDGHGLDADNSKGEQPEAAEPVVAPAEASEAVEPVVAPAEASEAVEPVVAPAEASEAVEPLVAPAEAPASQGDQIPVAPQANGDASPVALAEAPASQGEEGSVEQQANGDAPPAAPAEAPASKGDEGDVEPQANGDARPAESPTKGHRVSPPKVDEQHEESDSLSLGDTDSEQNDPKGNAQGAADSARSERQPIAIPESTDQDKSNSAAKGSAEEPQNSGAAAAAGHGTRRPSPDPAAAPAPASKRKHSDIVFPDAATPAERPAPAKREKVELVVPEATDKTRALRISGLKRPLREAELKQILSKTGTIEGFWIDSCKTHCYVVYGTVEEARATLAAVDGLQWPPRCRSIMKPKYVALEEAQGMIDSKGAATLTRVPSTAADEGGAAAKPSGSAEDSVIDMTKAALPPPPRAPRADASQVAAGGSAPAEITPLELFNLTEARPSLYWLPLTEEQVAQRRGVDAARRARAAASADAGEDGDAGGEGDGGEEEEAGEDADEEACGGDGEAVPDGARDGDVEMVDVDGGKGADDD